MMGAPSYEPAAESAPRASHSRAARISFRRPGTVRIKLDGEELTLCRSATACNFFCDDAECGDLGRQRAEILVIVAQSQITQIRMNARSVVSPEQSATEATT